MGERALVCYQRESGRWECYYSHWGAVRLALEEPLADGLEPGEAAGRLNEVPVAHNQLRIDERLEGEVSDPHEIVAEVLSWGSHEALYLVPAVGDVQAFLALDVGTLGGAVDQPLRTGALVSPRRVRGERLTTAVSARWRGWKEVLGSLYRRGLVDDEDVLQELNTLAYAAWGKPPRPALVPGFSPLGSEAIRGAVNISRLLAEREQAVTDPDR